MTANAFITATVVARLADEWVDHNTQRNTQNRVQPVRGDSLPILFTGHASDDCVPIRSFSCDSRLSLRFP